MSGQRRELSEHELREREQAGQRLLAMPPPPGTAEPEWEDQKREILDTPARKWPGG
jgi:hypothetical protein